VGPESDRELALRRGAGERGLVDGIGLRLEVLETPGHTPEGISIVVYDLARSADDGMNRSTITPR